MENWTKKIKETRKKMKIKQTEMAERVGCSTVTMSNLEQGKNVGIDLLQKVCKELNLEILIKDVE